MRIVALGKTKAPLLKQLKRWNTGTVKRLPSNNFMAKKGYVWGLYQ